MYFSAIFIKDLFDFAKLKGVDIKSIEDAFSNLNDQKYVSYDAIVTVINKLNGELHDDCLGLHIGEQIALEVTRAVDNIMQNSKSLEDSMKHAIKYSKLISDALECSFQKDKNYFSIIYEENPNWKIHQSFARRQVLDITLLSNIKALETYTNYQYSPIRIHLSYEKPRKLYEYYRLFNCSLTFNQQKTEIFFERQIIDRHTKKVNFGLLESLREKVADEIQNLPAEDRLIYQLKKCILNSKPHRILINEAAKGLNVSTRTLQRKLNRLNTSFKEIELGLQIKLAKTYLEENQKSLDEISYLLGFSESSAFIRFFKSYTKRTPIEYQRNTI